MQFHGGGSFESRLASAARAEGEARSSVEVATYTDLDKLVDLTREVDLELTQVSSGRFQGRTVRASLGDVKMHLSKLSLTTICQGEVSPGHAIVILPSRWRGELRWNGTILDEPAPIMFTREYIRRASDLELVGFVLNLRTLKATAAALAGVTADEIEMPQGVIRAPRRLIAAQVAAMVELAQTCREDLSLCDDRDFARRGEHRIAMASAELLANLHGQAAAFKPMPVRKKRIAQLAEERFESAGATPVFLPDLCVAAGVSARTLQYVFRDLYGMGPIRYFKMRRISQAHDLLRRATPESGAIKRAALDAGIHELGRFSVEYRKLFGESPSATLTRAPD
ncbi:MAG: AraC family transcriptional regulator [Deltaproteobacteria bacterium]|nr:AraC family transcriptional regulator [Deltaproteobacteria bacterium]